MEEPLNDAQQYAIRNCLKTGVGLIAAQHNAEQIFDLILNYHPDTHRDFLTNFENPLIKRIMLNLRSLAVGRTINLVIGEDATHVLEEGDIPPFNLSSLGNVTQEAIANYTRAQLQPRIHRIIQVHQAAENMINQAEQNLVAAVEQPQIPAPEVLLMAPPDVTSSLSKAMHGIGRGIWDFFLRLANPILHPIQTIEGLAFLVAHPIEAIHAMRQQLVDYAQNDPVAFATNATLNVFLLTLSAALPTKLGSSSAFTATKTQEIIRTPLAHVPFSSSLVPATRSIAVTTPLAPITGATISPVTVAASSSFAGIQAGLSNNRSENKANDEEISREIKKVINDQDYKSKRRLFKTKLISMLLKKDRPQDSMLKNKEQTPKTTFEIDLTQPIKIIDRQAAEQQEPIFTIDLLAAIAEKNGPSVNLRPT